MKTVAQSKNDILIDINLSPFSDNVIFSVINLLTTLEEQRNVTISKPNSDNFILFFFDEMSLKNAYRSILELIILAQDPEIFEYIQESLSCMNEAKNDKPEKLENPVLTSLSIKYHDNTYCKIQLPYYKSFMKSSLADVVSGYLESCGNLEIPFPDFNDDEVTMIFHELSDALSFEMFVVDKLL